MLFGAPGRCAPRSSDEEIPLNLKDRALAGALSLFFFESTFIDQVNPTRQAASPLYYRSTTRKELFYDYSSVRGPRQQCYAHDRPCGLLPLEGELGRRPADFSRLELTLDNLDWTGRGRAAHCESVTATVGSVTMGQCGLCHCLAWQDEPPRTFFSCQGC